MDRSKKLCITNHYENRTNLELQELIYNDISKNLISSFNYSIITDNQSVIIEEKETIYEIISSNNKNPNKKTSYIDLGKCESILKNFYEINQNESLIILKMDTFVEGKTGATSVYEIFYPLENSITLVKLCLTVCEGEKISLSYSMELSDPELYDKKNPVYSDICARYSLKNGADATLREMQNDYLKNNKSLCEENCEYIGYDKIAKIYKCDCDMKENLPKISEIKNDKDKLYNFDKIKKIANFEVLRCTNLISNKEGLIKNIGFISYIPTFIVFFVIIFIFYIKENKIIKKKINKFTYAKSVFYLMRQKKIEKGLLIKGRKEQFFKEYLKNHNTNYLNAIKSEILNIINIKNTNSKMIIKQYSSILDLKEEENNSKENENGSNNNNDNIRENDIIIAKKIVQNSLSKKHKRNKKKPNEKNNMSSSLQDFKINKNMREEAKNILKINEGELNNLDYKSALENDDRTICQYYYSLLRSEHMLLKIFNSKDYNSSKIKFYLCFYEFGLSFTVNALFFNDENIEQIFKDNGKFNLLYQIPNIIFSSIITFIFSYTLDSLAFSGEYILIFKNEKITESLANTINNAKKLWIFLQLKFLYFFIISFLFCLICWYYITCFCAVYKNTQYHLLTDTIISFVICLLNPFILKLIPSILRIYGIKHKNPFIFKLSKIFEIIC